MGTGALKFAFRHLLVGGGLALMAASVHPTRAFAKPMPDTAPPEDRSSDDAAELDNERPDGETSFDRAKKSYRNRPVERTCHREQNGQNYAVCFDPGNRWMIGGGWGGRYAFGSPGSGMAGQNSGDVEYLRELDGAIYLRHTLEKPNYLWRFEHQFADTRWRPGYFETAFYRGRIIRHSEDGKMVVHFGRPRTIKLPFDIGIEAETGTLQIDQSAATGGGLAPYDIGVIRMAILFDFARSKTVRRRFAAGLVTDWNLRYDRDNKNVSDHQIAPMSLFLLDGYLESFSGLTLAGARIEGGYAWSSQAAEWQAKILARANIERVLIAINDKPLSLVIEGETDIIARSATGLVGMRFGLSNGRR